MTHARAALIGIGNEYRHDDGIGPAVVRGLSQGGLCADGLVITVVEPIGLLEAWYGASLAVIVDAAVGDPPSPGRVRRLDLGEVTPVGPVGSSHGLGISEVLRLAQALERAPARVVVVTIEAECLGYGRGLSAGVAAAIPEAQRMVLAELGFPPGSMPSSTRLPDNGNPNSRPTSATEPKRLLERAEGLCLTWR